MKKLFSMLAMSVVTLTCGILLAACGGTPPPAEEPTYSTLTWVSEPDKSLHIMYENAEPNGQGGYNSINDQPITLSIVPSQDGYEFPADFWLKVNGQEVTLRDEGNQYNPMKLAQFTVNSDATLEVSPAVEKQATLNFVVRKNLLDGQDYPDNIFVRFEDYAELGLPKAEYNLAEYSEMLSHTDLHGTFGMVNGTVVYTYTKNFATTLKDDMMSYPVEGQLSSTREVVEAYYDEANKYYGYKTTIIPQEVNATSLMVPHFARSTDVDYQIYGGIATEPQLPDPIKHVVQNPHYIAHVNPINPLFIMRFLSDDIIAGDDDDANAFDFYEMFGKGGKLTVEINLLKYNDPAWRPFYDQMEIKVMDKDIDFEIVGGKITFQLDLPYKYLSEEHRTFTAYEVIGETADPDDPLSHVMILTGYNMFAYHIYTNLVDLIREAGLIDKQCHSIQTFIRDSPEQVVESGIPFYRDGIKETEVSAPLDSSYALTVGVQDRFDAEYGENYYNVTKRYEDYWYLRDTPILYFVDEIDMEKDDLVARGSTYVYDDFDKIAITINGQRTVYDLTETAYDEMNAHKLTSPVAVGKELHKVENPLGEFVTTGAHYYIKILSSTTIDKIELLHS